LLWFWVNEDLPNIVSIGFLGYVLDDGGGDGNLKILHGPGEKVNPHFLANFDPQMLLSEGTLEQGFDGKGKGGWVDLDLGAILRQRYGGHLGGKGGEEDGGVRQDLMQGFEVLRGEGVRAHNFYEVAIFAGLGLGVG
jgi:hypothetical protein